jgi:Cdc6-like AAA superfamily ATPase
MMARVLSYTPLSSSPNIYTPTKLIKREKQLSQLFQIYESAKRGHYPTVVCIAGPKSFGKTVTVLHFIKELQTKDPNFRCVYLTCKSTLRKSAAALFQNVPRERTDVIDVIAGEGGLVFFDDVQNIVTSSTFNRELFNLEMKYFYDNYKDRATPIFMTNIPLRDLQKCFSEEVLSRMSWPLGIFINFPSYSLNDIYQILLQRCQEALAPNSWEIEAVKECAKYGAENKDLRLAIDLLRDACKYPDDTLKVEHVKQALERKGVESLSLDLDNLPTHARLYLLALTLAELKRPTGRVTLDMVDTIFQGICNTLEVSFISRTSRWKVRQKLELEQFIETHVEKRVIPDAIGKPRTGTTTYLKLTIPPQTMLKAFKICTWDDIMEAEKVHQILNSASEVKTECEIQ